MLGAGGHAIALDSLHIAGGHFAGKVGIFGEIFKIAAAEGAALDVEAWAQHHMDNDTALENAKNADALVAAENDRIEEAKQTASIKIDEMLSQLDSCMQALTRIKESNRPAYRVNSNGAFDYDQVEGKNDSTDSMADEISASLQALVGTTEDTAPTAEPHHPVADTTTKFANLQFGKNYEVSQR